MHVFELTTPALVVDADAFDHNLSVMSASLPGARLRPHVKAHKTTAISRCQSNAGHHGFTCATVREVEGMAAAGLGVDLLLANEIVDVNRLRSLGALVQEGSARVTIAVDSEETVDAAFRAGLAEVLIDVNVGLPRCGCNPADAERIADLARAHAMTVRGVMGYEGHAVGVDDRVQREAMVNESMTLLREAHDRVGGEIISAGGTGSYDINTEATEIQAGSYILMDTAYAKLGLPFRHALSVMSTVISVSDGGWAVCDAGLKSLGMDHGNPTIAGIDIWFCSDEHITFSVSAGVGGAAEAGGAGADGVAEMGPANSTPKVGDRVAVLPAHIDPTVAYHETMYLARNGEVIDVWPVDLRGW